MKKLLTYILFLSMLLTGCKSNQNTTNQIIEQAFHNIQFELIEGEIVVEEGEELILCHQNGTPIDYEIKDDTLIITNRSKGSIYLTLPTGYIYDSIDINSTGGDITFKPMPTTTTLNTEVTNGNIVLTKVNSTNTNILLHDGYIFMSGSFGENVDLVCEEGYIKLKPNTQKVEYNFNINLTEEAYLNLGGYRYDNVKITEQVYNRKNQTMNIDIQSGNVIIKFKS